MKLTRPEDVGRIPDKKTRMLNWILNDPEAFKIWWTINLAGMTIVGIVFISGLLWYGFSSDGSFSEVSVIIALFIGFATYQRAKMLIKAIILMRKGVKDPYGYVTLTEFKKLVTGKK